MSHSKIIEYQAEWPRMFEAEKEKLAKVFGNKLLDIEHIGSTSVKGLASKPIIDIVVMIKGYKDAELFNEKLSEIGYHFDSSSSERHFYRRGDPTEYHLSIAYANKGGFWSRQILFRDYLREHDEVRDEYGRLKKAMLIKDPSGRDTYFEGKTAFIYRILDLAGWKKDQTYEESKMFSN